MRVLLVNSPWINTKDEYGIKSGTRWPQIRKRDRSMPYFPFPYFMACVTALLKREDFDAHIKDAVAEEISKDDCLDYIANFKPDLLVIEAFTPSIYIDLAFAKEAKALSQCRVALCGAHPTALPEEMLKNGHIDFVLLGEYDYTLRDLCFALSQDKNNFTDIKGLAFRDQGKIVINPRREPIADLDQLPYPNRDEMPVHKYNEPVSKYSPNATIVSTRGCPYHCIFCIEPHMWGRQYRRRSVAHVLGEIEMLIEKYKIREIFFDDALFTIPRAKEIARGILDRRMKIAWTCWMDWNIGIEDIKLLKRSGCVALKFGIESASAKTLNTIGKNIKIEKIRELIKRCRRLGLLTHGSFMLGLPDETMESMRATVNLAFSLGLSACQFSIATPLPGTAFYDMAVKNKWLSTNDWTKFESTASVVVEYAGCSKDYILQTMDEVRKRKVRQFFKNPFYVIVYAWKIYRLKGAKGFCDEILKKSKFVLRSLFGKR